MQPALPTPQPAPQATLTVRDFIAKWGPGGPAHALTERAGAQAHFIDRCRLLGVAEPGAPERDTLEKGLTRTGTGTGSGRTDRFADVWLKGHFA